MSSKLRTCAKCSKSKPLSEFHKHNRYKDGYDKRCKDCVNTRPRAATPARINRTRARHRAVADLIARHPDEFEQLLQTRLAEAEQEAAELADAARTKARPAAHSHPEQPTIAEVPRLRPGARREGQTTTDRLDVARCPHCRKHHDRGHRCEVCGARPGERTEGTPVPTRMRKRGGIDPAALAEFNAGTERARNSVPS